ncbi:MarR family transcriptional regulator [Cellulomonas chitinilytica]|uniref:MarR family transcriptional regulator n=1 Tax=Cellulomonas chitinilytica TaxID=398759 RepID=A0A919NZF6_9CELL|nr:MarR family winged helix-turn-helix transcriptional regulator [Cellulomonas chitinilytica]GIG20493.1 MarR family transcriptional regulator [Cellulomonas chitinilytica]
METWDAPARVRALPSWLVSQVALQARNVVARHFGAVGGHRTQFTMLAALAEFGPMSQADLGRRVGLDRSDVAAAVAALAADGLLDRTPDPHDRRRNVVRVTTEGQVRLAALDAAAHAAQDELLAGLSTAERDQLAALLARVAGV